MMLYLIAVHEAVEIGKQGEFKEFYNYFPVKQLILYP